MTHLSYVYYFGDRDNKFIHLFVQCLLNNILDLDVKFQTI